MNVNPGGGTRREYRAEVLLPGDVTEWGTVREVYGRTTVISSTDGLREVDPYVDVQFVGGTSRRILRREIVTVTKGPR